MWLLPNSALINNTFLLNGELKILELMLSSSSGIILLNLLAGSPIEVLPDASNILVSCLPSPSPEAFSAHCRLFLFSFDDVQILFDSSNQLCNKVFPCFGFVGRCGDVDTQTKENLWIDAIVYISKIAACELSCAISVCLLTRRGCARKNNISADAS